MLLSRGLSSRGFVGHILKNSWSMQTKKHATLAKIKEDLARNLKRIRLEKGFAQERLALEADVDRTVVSKIERGVTNPSLEILLRLANQLEVELTDLLMTTGLD